MTKRYTPEYATFEGAFDGRFPTVGGVMIDHEEPDNETITFKSGHTIYANNGIVGLSPELKVFEGYDGGVDWPPAPPMKKDWRDKRAQPRKNALTKADMRELADTMIKRWKQFRKTVE